MRTPSGFSRDLSMSQSFDVVVIGAGPGGYVAAIRCAQSVYGPRALSGSLHWVGPACALAAFRPRRWSSERYVEAQHHLEEHGVKVKGVGLDRRRCWPARTRSSRLTDGVAHLLKKNGVERLTDMVPSSDGPMMATIQVKGAETDVTITGQKVIIAMK